MDYERNERLQQELLWYWREQTDLWWGYVAWNAVLHFLPKGKMLTSFQRLKSWLQENSITYEETTWQERKTYYAKVDAGEEEVTGLKRPPVPTWNIVVGIDGEISDYD